MHHRPDTTKDLHPNGRHTSARAAAEARSERESISVELVGVVDREPGRGPGGRRHARFAGRFCRLSRPHPDGRAAAPVSRAPCDRSWARLLVPHSRRNHHRDPPLTRQRDRGSRRVALLVGSDGEDRPARTRQHRVSPAEEATSAGPAGPLQVLARWASVGQVRIVATDPGPVREPVAAERGQLRGTSAGLIPLHRKDFSHRAAPGA